MTRLAFCAATAALLTAAAQASAATLYDATATAVEMNQAPWNWSYLSLPSSSTHSFDTPTLQTTLTSSTANSAGYSITTPSLNLPTGFGAQFKIDVKSESHTSNNRAGTSFILLSSNSTGIELAFWPNEIWAQNDNNQTGYFTHGEGNTTLTTSGLHTYLLTMNLTSYTLYQDDLSVLTGPLRNYSGYPNPVYSQKNFLFLGDDTTEAAGSLGIQQVSIAVP